MGVRYGGGVGLQASEQGGGMGGAGSSGGGQGAPEGGSKEKRREHRGVWKVTETWGEVAQGFPRGGGRRGPESVPELGGLGGVGLGEWASLPDRNLPLTGSQSRR